jgi:hypothetical protein
MARVRSIHVESQRDETIAAQMPSSRSNGEEAGPASADDSAGRLDRLDRELLRALRELSLKCPWSLSWRHAVPTEAYFVCTRSHRGRLQ